MCDIRPKGTVEVECTGPMCSAIVAGTNDRMCFWVKSDDPRLPDGPFSCPECSVLAQLPKVLFS
jgi:hypothetical protein